MGRPPRINPAPRLPQDGVGLTLTLEAGPVERLPSIRQAVSYGGLCSAQRSSAGVDKRGPLSKQRNHFLQTALIEAAKLAPRWNPILAEVYEKELRRGHRNRATLAVARKLVAYLWAADRGHQPIARPEPAEAFLKQDRSIDPMAAA
jgi:transposase